MFGAPGAYHQRHAHNLIQAHPLFLNAEMAGRRQAFQSNPELQQFLIPEARPTGKQLGVGSYGSVEELQMNGLVCAGKRLHDALLQRDNAGVANIERKYIEECQVMPTIRRRLPNFLSLTRILCLCR